MSTAEGQDTITAVPSNVIRLSDRLTARPEKDIAKASFVPDGVSRQEHEPLSDELDRLCHNIVLFAEAVRSGSCRNEKLIAGALGRFAVNTKMTMFRAEKLERKLRKAKGKAKSRH